MPFELTEPQIQIQETAREFADKILIPNADRYDRLEEFPRDNIEKPADLGFMGIRIRIRIVVASMAGFAALELAARLYVETRQEDPGAYPWGHPVLPRSASNYVPHPFTAFALDPNHPEHTDQGVRGQEPVDAGIVSGGVAANAGLRRRFDSVPYPVYFPSLKLCTDNAAMIAAAAYPRLERGERSAMDLTAKPGLAL